MHPTTHSSFGIRKHINWKLAALVSLPILSIAPSLAAANFSAERDTQPIGASSEDLDLRLDFDSDVSLDLNLAARDGIGRGDQPEIEIVTGVWFARFGGFINVDGIETSVEDAIDLDRNAEPTANFEASILDDDGFVSWRLTGVFWHAGVTEPADTGFRVGDALVGAGQVYNADVHLDSISLEHAVRRWTVIPRAAEDGTNVGDAVDATLDFSALLGGRWMHVEQRVESLAPLGNVDERDANWVGLFAGVRMELNWEPEDGLMIGESFRITGEFAAGATLNLDGGGFWHVRAGGELEVVQDMRLFFGYRLLEINSESDDWIFDAGLQGLFAGATISF